jgi:hypothetical protein
MFLRSFALPSKSFDQHGTYNLHSKDPIGSVEVNLQAGSTAILYLAGITKLLALTAVGVQLSSTFGQALPMMLCRFSDNITPAALEYLDTSGDGKLTKEDDMYTPFYPGKEALASCRSMREVLQTACKWEKLQIMSQG